MADRTKGRLITASRSEADTNMAVSGLLTQFAQAGWITHVLESTNKHTQKKGKKKYEGFVILSREIKNPVNSGQNIGAFSPNSQMGKMGVSGTISGATSRMSSLKNISTAGAAAYVSGPKKFCTRPQGGGGSSAASPQVPMSAGSGTSASASAGLSSAVFVPAAPSGTGAASALVPSPGGALVPSLDQIPTIRDMRLVEPSFCLGFDSEFYHLGTQRYVLSWQFAFVRPDRPDAVEELIVFSDCGKRLRLSMILNYIIEKYGLYALFLNRPSNDGVSYYSTRRWNVPVLKRTGTIGQKSFDNFKDAVAACADPAVKQALRKAGPNAKAMFDYIDGPGGKPVKIALNAVNDCPIGYVNYYGEANKQALPVTLVCHTGSADLSTLDVEDLYEKDIMLQVSSVQGGLVTLSEFFLHNPCLGKYYNFYPVKLSIRDTMCFAPAKQKKLEDLGNVINVPKLEVPAPYSKNDMLAYMLGDPLGFADYAVNDAVIAVLYCHELWGCNRAMPVTISSAAGKAAVPIIAEHFGLDRNDRKGFDEAFRGLRTVKRGRVKRSDVFGFLQNTSLEPVDADAEQIQLYARNAYKGGYNGSVRIGFFPFMTYDYDLENAYPTCMSLVPDIDWNDSIAFEEKNKKLTSMMVRTPFDPVFAVVDFEFPATVRYPCIPQTVDGSMVYARQGKGVYASAPELFLALQLGADITYKRLIVGNVRHMPDGTVSHSLFSVVKRFVEDRNIAQQVFGKGSLPDLLEKTAVCSIYGKTAQDVIDKTTWSAMVEAMVDIGGSPITSPVHACLTTAGVRAVLLATMNQLADLGYDTYSVTTDGFISNAPFDVVDGLSLYGFSPLFRKARVMLTGDPAMWQTKHEQDDLVNLTTRGNASLNVGDKAAGKLPGVMAHNSFVTGAEKPDSLEDRELFLEAVLSRTGRVVCHNKSFAHFKDLAKREGRLDFSVRDQERKLSMDFDLKRKPVESSFYTAYPAVKSQTMEIACFDSVPYEDIAEYEYWKKVGRGCEVLRTVADWSVFFRRLAGIAATTSSVRDLEWSRLMSAVMAFRLKVPLDFLGGDSVSLPVLETKALTLKQKLMWLSGFNNSKHSFSECNWKDCGRQNRTSRMLPEKLYQGLLMDMMAWTPPDGSPLMADAEGWDAVNQLDFSAAGVGACAHAIVIGAGVPRDDEESA